MNKKGSTLIEVSMTIVLIGMLMYSVIYIPTNLISKHSQYILESGKVTDLSLLRTAIVNDLNHSNIKVTNENVLLIGESTYTFGEQVTRENKGNKIVVAYDPYSYKIEDNSLIVYNDKTSMKYNLYNSFTKAGVNHE